MIPTATSPLAIVLLLVLAVVLPLLGVWEYRRFLRMVRAGRSDARIVAYTWTIAIQWILTLGFLAWWRLSGGELAPLRLVPEVAGKQWIAVGAGLALAAGAVIQMAAVLRRPEQLVRLRDQAGDLLAIAPRTPAESRLFAALSCTAGVCEEILYRGLLLAVLGAAVGLWPAVLLSTAVFGLGHAYQGAAGILKTAAVGLVLALLAVGSGSLFVPMLVHAVIDLVNGPMLGRAATATASQSAAEPSADASASFSRNS